MKTNIKNKYIILPILVMLIIFINGCSQKEITKDSTGAVASSIAIKSSKTQAIPTKVYSDKFVNVGFEKGVKNIYKQCTTGWKNGSYNLDYTNGDYIKFSKKYNKLEGLNNYEKQVFKDVVELNVTIYNYLKWNKEGSNSNETPTMKIRIESLIKQYSSIFIE